MIGGAAGRLRAVRGVLFDVDGTLYDQRPLRLLMALEWASHAAARPHAGWEAWRAIRWFRRTREELRVLGRPPALLEDLQYTEAARRSGIDERRLRGIIDEWMFRRPLRHLRRCRRRGVADLFADLRERRVEIGVVSDYPALSKLKALGLADAVSLTVCTTDAEVNAFKPHPAGLAHACATWRMPPEDILYVGDRADVDRAAAVAAGVPCVILGRDDGATDFHELRRTLAAA